MDKQKVSDDSPVERVFESIWKTSDDLWGSVVEKEFSMSTVLPLTAEVMRRVQQFSYLSGLEKKQVVVRVIEQILKNSDVVESSDMKRVLTELVPVAIDLLVEIDHEGLFKRIKSKWCCPLFKHTNRRRLQHASSSKRQAVSSGVMSAASTPSNTVSSSRKSQHAEKDKSNYVFL